MSLNWTRTSQQQFQKIPIRQQQKKCISICPRFIRFNLSLYIIIIHRHHINLKVQNKNSLRKLGFCDLSVSPSCPPHSLTLTPSKHDALHSLYIVLYDVPIRLQYEVCKCTLCGRMYVIMCGCVCFGVSLIINNIIIVMVVGHHHHHITRDPILSVGIKSCIVCVCRCVPVHPVRQFLFPIVICVIIIIISLNILVLHW